MRLVILTGRLDTKPCISEMNVCSLVSSCCYSHREKCWLVCPECKSHWEAAWKEGHEQEKTTRAGEVSIWMHSHHHLHAAHIQNVISTQIHSMISLFKQSQHDVHPHTLTTRCPSAHIDNAMSIRTHWQRDVHPHTLTTRCPSAHIDNAMSIRTHWQRDVHSAPLTRDVHPHTLTDAMSIRTQWPFLFIHNFISA